MPPNEPTIRSAAPVLAAPAGGNPAVVDRGRRLLLVHVLAAASALIDSGSASAQQRKPTLTVWTTDSCAPCKRFKQDYELDDDFRKAIDDNYRVVFKDWDTHRDEFVFYKINAVPTFFNGAPDQRFTGYASPDPDQTASAWFLLTLGIRGPPPPPPQRPVPRRQDAPDPRAMRSSCGCREEFARIAAQLAELRREIAVNRSAVNAANDWINADQTAGELTDLRRRVQSLAEELQTIEQTPGPPGERGPAGPRGEPGPERTVTVIFEDDAGKRLADPVVVPPGASRVRVPVERFVRD